MLLGLRSRRSLCRSPRIRTSVATGDCGRFLPVFKTAGPGSPRLGGSIPSPRRAVAVASEPAIGRAILRLTHPLAAAPRSHPSHSRPDSDPSASPHLTSSGQRIADSPGWCGDSLRPPSGAGLPAAITVGRRSSTTHYWITPQGVTAARWPLRCKFGSAGTAPSRRSAARNSGERRLAPGAWGWLDPGGRPVSG